MDAGGFHIERLNPRIGARVTGVDLGAPLSPASQKELHRAGLAHKVLFFPGQPLTAAQHLDLARVWGEPQPHPLLAGSNEAPERLALRPGAAAEAHAASDWRSDGSYQERPPRATLLHRARVPELGGDHVFTDMTAAWAELSGRWQRLLDGLMAVHESVYVHRPEPADRAPVDGVRYPEARHPVVRTHPETGRKALFVNPIYTTRIRGMKRIENRATLAFLFEHIRDPRFQCCIPGEANSTIFWDNRCVSHRPVQVDGSPAFEAHRVLVQGERPMASRGLAGLLSAERWRRR